MSRVPSNESLYSGKMTNWTYTQEDEAPVSSDVYCVCQQFEGLFNYQTACGSLGETAVQTCVSASNDQTSEFRSGCNRRKRRDVGDLDYNDVDDEEDITSFPFSQITPVSV